MVTPAESVDAYIAGFPDAGQDVLRQVRATLANAVPGSAEKISYGMPTLTLDGRPVLCYAAWKMHLGLYPVPVGETLPEAELAPYRSTKDTLRFRYADPIPYPLLGRIAAGRAGSG